MPIYAYRCESCGFGKDVLQKMSDPQLTQCPECGKDTFRKQVTAAGFQLKGSGWYVTDFRGGNSGAPAKADANGASNGAANGAANGASGENAAAASNGAAKSDTAAASSSAAAPAAPAATPAASTPASGSSSV
ncbi:putative FmdB family regulatory protein [Paraburkholderia sp. GV068]|jgi:putative FmdB family regulatory protein|uniref:FmdB family zinc ribbon protein n=1 Tax=unclassified Paraburkholderia TaxID=2615204 RepID=UPI0006B3EDB4|nr:MULTISPECIES: zinc ribbon domain-containing protein [unclassified Paraburkholderia]ALE53647.1 FmdB family transcriptional regulator [Burkholderia sp. HB1]PTR02727.1 putative FmdB family regulatory protein [Paraburkholderia sp. GV072]PUB07204.1 putative FmdB family regulatory protein [Paraburkholderia sp. GV068]